MKLWCIRPRELLKIVLRMLMALLALLLTLLLAFLTYGFFYCWYIPQMRHVLPVYLHFGSTTTSFSPWAQIELETGLLRDSIKYDISLEMEIPDQHGLSERVGMFMIGLEVADMKQERPCLLRYRSELVRSAELLVTLPLLLLGWRQETFTQRIFLAEQVKLPSNTSSVKVTISRSDVPIRQAQLHIVANLRGLRYLMYYWRWTMALIMTMFFFGLYTIFFVILALTAYTIYCSRCYHDNSSDSESVDWHYKKEELEEQLDDSESEEEASEVPDISSSSATSASQFVSRSDSILLNGCH